MQVKCKNWWNRATSGRRIFQKRPSCLISVLSEEPDTISYYFLQDQILRQHLQMLPYKIQVFQRWMITAKLIHVLNSLKGILVFWATFDLQMRAIRIRMESLSNKVKYGEKKIQTSIKKRHFIQWSLKFDVLCPLFLAVDPVSLRG